MNFFAQPTMGIPIYACLPHDHDSSKPYTALLPKNPKHVFSSSEYLLHTKPAGQKGNAKMTAPRKMKKARDTGIAQYHPEKKLTYSHRWNMYALTVNQVTTAHATPPIRQANLYIHARILVPAVFVSHQPARGGHLPLRRLTWSAYSPGRMLVNTRNSSYTAVYMYKFRHAPPSRACLV